MYFMCLNLKKVIGDCIPESKLPKGLTEEMEIILQPAEVLGVRKDSKGNHFVLVRWKDLPGYEATWEPTLRTRWYFRMGELIRMMIQCGEKYIRDAISNLKGHRAIN